MGDDVNGWFVFSMICIVVAAFSVGAWAGDDVRTKWFERHGCSVKVEVLK